MKRPPNRAAACRFFSYGKAVLMAMEAYSAAAVLIEPPAGEAWFDEYGNAWANETLFAECFIEEMCQRINAAAVAAAVPYASHSVYPGLGWELADGHNAELSTSENAQIAPPDNRPDNALPARVS
ncbi:MAG: hypothetical protein KGJ81_18375 [Alphaproteobacteria bacterium]|nr:hypothetical protein [Alphaproteobacteria bacterium]